MDIFEKEIFVEFQNFNLNKMRMVSNEFLKSIDGKSKYFYCREDFQMKNLWEAMIQKHIKIFDHKNELNKNLIKTLDDKIINKIKHLELKKVCWFGYFANVLNCKFFVLFKIKSLFCMIYESVNLECKLQLEILEKIKILESKKKNIESKFEKIYPTNKKNLSEEQNNFQIECVKLQDKYKKFIISSNLMKNLFGGRKFVENLPILCIEEHTYIPYEVIKAPIMQGTYKNGREFFLIRLVSTYPYVFYSELGCEEMEGGFEEFLLIGQCLSVESKGGKDEFLTSEYRIISGNQTINASWKETIIDHEGGVNERLYSSLSKFIQEKGNDKYKIC